MGMLHATKFLHSFRLRHSLTAMSMSSHYSSFSRFNHFTITITTATNYAKFDSVKTLLKTLQLSLRRRASIFQSHLTNTANCLRNIHFSGSNFSSASILGVSVASASIIAHAMDAEDALVDDPCDDSLDISEEEENVHQLWKLARKFWLPVFFFLTVLTNLDDPITLLFIKVTLFLLSTKPNPFSVYIFVDQLCQQSMRQETQLLKVKSLYASKVEVQDYKFLCLAAVEVRDEKFTLVGILGTWWTLPHLPSWGAFSLVRNRLGSILVKTTEQSNLLISN